MWFLVSKQYSSLSQSYTIFSANLILEYVDFVEKLMCTDEIFREKIKAVLVCAYQQIYHSDEGIRNAYIDTSKAA